MAMNGTNSYGPTPYGTTSYAGAQQPMPNAAAGDPAALSRSIDDQLKAYTSRGGIPTSLPSAAPTAGPMTLASLPHVTASSSSAPDAAGTDPGQQGNVSWALLMEMKKSGGEALSPAEQSRYDAIMARANGGTAPASGPAAAPDAAGTDPGQQGNVTWALLMEMKKSSGGGLSPAEQARYDAIMARANQAPASPVVRDTAPTITTPTRGQQTTIPTELPDSPAPTAPTAPTAAPMSQETYDSEVKWALTFEKSPEAARYNAFNQEKKVRNGTVQGKSTMSDQTFATEGAWAQQLRTTPDILRYKKVAAEVQRRKGTGERTRPMGLLDKVKGFFTGLFSRFTSKKTPPAASQTAQQPAGDPGSSGAPPSGAQAPAPTSR